MLESILEKGNPKFGFIVQLFVGSVSRPQLEPAFCSFMPVLQHLPLWDNPE